MLMAIVVALIFFGCEKENFAPEAEQDAMEESALKAKKVRTDFTGTCMPLPLPPIDAGTLVELPNGRTKVMGNVSDWAEEASDPRITGISRWDANYFWEGEPFASPAKVFGKTTIFVGGDAESNVGVWEMTWHGNVTIPGIQGPFNAICYGNGVGKSGIVKGMTGKWTYTLTWIKIPVEPFLVPCYLTEGYIK